MKTILYFISLLALMTCVKEKHTINKELKSDKLVAEIFNDKEIVELGKIILFFESQIREEVNEFNIQRSYKKFLKLDSMRLVDGGKLFMIDYKKQKKLYSNLDPDFLEAFFDKGYLTLINPENKEHYKVEFLHLKVYNSDSLSIFAKFIENYSKFNNHLKDYIKSAKISNEFFGPSDQGRFILNYRNFDFNDIKNRLIYSMNHLIINERNKKLI